MMRVYTATETDEAMAIVRDLAGADPVVAGEVHGDPECSLCDGDLGWKVSVDEHDASCPWRRAKELVG